MKRRKRHHAKASAKRRIKNHTASKDLGNLAALVRILADLIRIMGDVIK